jgi:Protein of unknown function (DUF3349)
VAVHPPDGDHGGTDLIGPGSAGVAEGGGVTADQVRVPDHLLDDLAMLRRCYPSGVPASDYTALLVVLHDGYSARNLTTLVAALTGRPHADVLADAAAALARQDAPSADVTRVRDHLAAGGWRPEG